MAAENVLSKLHLFLTNNNFFTLKKENICNCGNINILNFNFYTSCVYKEEKREKSISSFHWSCNYSFEDVTFTFSNGEKIKVDVGEVAIVKNNIDPNSLLSRFNSEKFNESNETIH